MPEWEASLTAMMSPSYVQIFNWNHHECETNLWHCMVPTPRQTRTRWLMIRRKKERTTALVVSAVLAGFRAIDTGKLSSVLYFMARLKGTWFPACQPKHYRSVLLSR